jgi:hypothetical protein
MAGRFAIIAALALKFVNEPQNQAIMNPHGVSICQDSVHRNDVFEQLKTAMTEAGYSSADILRESDALDEDVANQWGSVNFEEGVYIYTPNVGQQHFSQDEQTLFQQLVEFFKQMKNCIGGTIKLVQGMNLWEQLNALLLASGLIGFATQCVNLGRAAGNCAINFGEMSYNTLKRLVKGNGNGNDSIVLKSSQNKKSIYRFQGIVDKVISLNNSNALFKKGLVRQTLRNMLSVIEKIHISENKKNNPLNSIIDVNEVSEKVWALLRANPVKFITNDIRYRYKEEDDDFNIDGGRKSKRRPYKSKRRRTKSRSSKKRRHYKTKKRVYRSTRFRTHR